MRSRKESRKSIFSPAFPDRFQPLFVHGGSRGLPELHPALFAPAPVNIASQIPFAGRTSPVKNREDDEGEYVQTLGFHERGLRKIAEQTRSFIQDRAEKHHEQGNRDSHNLTILKRQKFFFQPAVILLSHSSNPLHRNFYHNFHYRFRSSGRQPGSVAVVGIEKGSLPFLEAYP